VLGFCHIELDPQSVWIESLAIDPAYQKQGLGAALAYRALKAHGVGEGRPAGLNVSSKNGAALEVYRRLGFLPQREKCRFGANRSDLIAATGAAQPSRPGETPR
jgi:ribosomal protein S18 acetylase RimI-like enzyme